MHTEVKRIFPEVTLERILAGLERELLSADDAEILEAARELGMNPSMRGSAAFLGLRYPAVPRAEEFFDTELFRRLWNEARQIRLAGAAPGTKPALPKTARPRGSSRTRTAGRKSPRSAKQSPDR